MGTTLRDIHLNSDTWVVTKRDINTQQQDIRQTVAQHGGTHVRQDQRCRLRRRGHLPGRRHVHRRLPFRLRHRSNLSTAHLHRLRQPFRTGPRGRQGMAAHHPVPRRLPHEHRFADRPLTGAYTADWWGRRKSLTFGVVVFIIGNVIQVTAMTSWVHMMMGRFVAGLGVGNLSVGVPMFQSECLPREIRGAVVASYQLMITAGILISNIINYGVREIEDQSASWRIVIGLGIFFSLPLGGGILAVPESPRWLAQRGRWEDARTSFARLRDMKDDPGNPLVEDDINEMRQILEKEQQVGSGSWLECFNPNTGVPKLVYRTLLGIGIHFLQQWTGVNYFFYYGATVFQSSGVDDPILVQLILGAVNVVTTLYGLWVVERFGRRWPLVIGAFWQSA